MLFATFVGGGWQTDTCCCSFDKKNIFFMCVQHRLQSYNVEHRKRIAAAMSNCKDLTEMSGLWDLDEDSVMMLMPIAPHLTRLDLTYALLGEAQLSDLISSCVNLYDLKVEYPPTHPPFYFLHWAFNNDISFVTVIPWMFLFPHWHRWQILLVMRGCE